MRVTQRACVGNASGKKLCRRCAVVAGKGKEILGKDRRGNDNGCFSEPGDPVKSNCRLGGCLLMVANKTDGAVVVVRRVNMIMGHGHERGKKEQKDEENGNTMVPAHNALFTHGHILSGQPNLSRH